MNQENAKKLFDRFQFFKPERSPRESLMCFGFECGDGWFQLIWDLCESIESQLAIDLHEGFEVLQVKEKFGGLRFYTTSCSNEIYDLVDDAEEASYITCEVCGSPGESNQEGWIRTLCDDCRRAE